MLRWDPKTRGGKAETATIEKDRDRDKCWLLLDNILDSVVSWCPIRMHSFEVYRSLERFNLKNLAWKINKK